MNTTDITGQWGRYLTSIMAVVLAGAGLGLPASATASLDVGDGEAPPCYTSDTDDPCPSGTCGHVLHVLEQPKAEFGLSVSAWYAPTSC